MGKYRHKQKKRHRDNKVEYDQRDEPDNLRMDNSDFEAYYRAQGIMDEDEWQSCMEHLRRGLPSAFRISGSRPASASLSQLVSDKFIPQLKQVHISPQDLEEVGVKGIKPPEQLPWYPGGLAWQFDLPRRVLRKFPEFKKFHEFLIYETEVGNISRQESVSMIPPLFLDVQPGDKVLDMCAAPGSKTAQLLEALHSTGSSMDSSESRNSGLLIANDSDLKRAHLLIHQSSRIPSDRFMVTNLDAASFPWLNLRDAASPGDRRLRFDKILCDVPCSGDGTLRKNPGIWKTWNVGNGNGLHSLQLRILCRAMAMLKHDAGGRIVYSTCTLNPVENEAVISSALNSVPGFELEDVQAQLPELSRRKGIFPWIPFPSPRGNSEGGGTWRSWDEYYEQKVRPLAQGHLKEEAILASIQAKEKLLPSMFPPNNASELHLDRCMRFYPHMMDSGGFFVAVLRRKQSSNGSSDKKALSRKQDDIVDKLDEIPAKRVRVESLNPCLDPPLVGDATLSANAAPEEEGESFTGDPGGAFKEPAFIFLPPDHPSLITLRERKMFSESFPYSQLFLHTAPPPPGSPLRDLPTRTIYLANPLVKSLIENNDYVRMRLVSAGSKVLSRQEKDGAQFRMMDEGLETIIPYIRTEDIVDGDLEDLRILLSEYSPFFTKFNEGRYVTTLTGRPQGNVISRFLSSQAGDNRPSHPLVLPSWKSTVSVTLMVNKKIKSSLSLRFFGEDITPEAASKTSGPTSTGDAVNLET